MVTRLLAAAAAVLLLGSCATTEMPARDAEASARSALADAGLPADDVHATPAGDGAWEVVAALDGGEARLVLDAGSGRFSSIALGEGAEVSQEQIESLAAHAQNPADRRTRERRALVASVLVVGAVALGLTLARRARLREENFPALLRRPGD